MKTVPHFLRGLYRSAMRLVGEAFQHSEQRRERGWKLFVMLPRCRPCRGENVHKEKLSKRFQDFSDGRWTELLAASRNCAEDASQAQRRKRRRHRPEEELGRRAARALALVQLGELSSGRQALEGASVANGTQQTLEALRDPDRLPPLPRDPLPEAILEHDMNLRSLSGAAAGLSGMTTDHLRLVLDQVRMCQMPDQFAQARIPPAVHNFLRLGRLTALQKPRGGVGERLPPQWAVPLPPLSHPPLPGPSPEGPRVVRRSSLPQGEKVLTTIACRHRRGLPSRSQVFGRDVPHSSCRKDSHSPRPVAAQRKALRDGRRPPNEHQQ